MWNFNKSHSMQRLVNSFSLVDLFCRLEIRSLYCKQLSCVHEIDSPILSQTPRVETTNTSVRHDRPKDCNTMSSGTWREGLCFRVWLCGRVSWRGWCVWGVANPLWSNKGSPPTDLSPGRRGEADELDILFQSFRIFRYLETGTSPGPRFRLFSFVKLSIGSSLPDCGPCALGVTRPAVVGGG